MAKSIRSKTKRKFRAVKRASTFAPTETSRLQRVVDHSNGIRVPYVPKRFSFLVKNFPEEPIVDAVMVEVVETVAGDAEMDDEKKVLTKTERQALMMTRNQYKLKAKADKKVKDKKRTKQRAFM